MILATSSQDRIRDLEYCAWALRDIARIRPRRIGLRSHKVGREGDFAKVVSLKLIQR
jgi:hypothetical protein